jgi:hypothetical protein
MTYISYNTLISQEQGPFLSFPLVLMISLDNDNNPKASCIYYAILNRAEQEAVPGSLLL